MDKKSVWNNYSPEQLAALEAFGEDYKSFLSTAKTERECVTEAVKLLEAAGFRDLYACGKLSAGDRVYVNHMGKALLAFVIGRSGAEQGMNILGAHIDSPRIDVKPNPLYESSELGYLDTHYYGGIKKYQWVTIPLALHGVVCTKQGETITLNIGEKEDDPVFCITDLLIHLAAEQMQKNAAKVIEGETLDLLIAGKPLPEEEKDGVKAGVLALLKERYGMEEEDFLSAELEIVPAGKARDLGLDRSMILGYGHDDRVCAYPSLRAVMDLEGTPERTLCCILSDKEEIGSVGASGMDSRFFEYSVAELLERMGSYSELTLKRMLRGSFMLSSDVSAGYDPLYAAAFEAKNSAYLGHGLCFSKYTGARGKSGSSDANPEFVAKVRAVMEQSAVSFQFAELGKVDVGGGGTIAEMCAKYCMNVLDAGVAVLSMHAPCEVISKADLFEAYRGYCAFLKEMH